MNYFLFRAVLPYEVKLGQGVNLWHRGLGVVIHPNTVIGDNVGIGHRVTIASNDTAPAVIGDGVKIGAAAILLPRGGRPPRVGAGSVVGGGSVVVGDVEAGTKVAGNPAKPITSRAT